MRIETDQEDGRAESGGTFEFQAGDQPLNLSDVVFQALGAASVCWENLAGAGVFDSQRAKMIGHEVMRWIRQNVGRPMERLTVHRPAYVVAKQAGAVQWWKNGDHPLDRVGEREVDIVALLTQRPELCGPDGVTGPIPEDAPTYERIEGAVVRFFRRPGDEYAGHLMHDVCGRTWHDHGWLDTGGDGQIVCPGDWILPGPVWPKPGERFVNGGQPGVLIVCPQCDGDGCLHVPDAEPDSSPAA